MNPSCSLSPAALPRAVAARSVRLAAPRGARRRLAGAAAAAAGGGGSAADDGQDAQRFGAGKQVARSAERQVSGAAWTRLGRHVQGAAQTCSAS